MLYLIVVINVFFIFLQDFYIQKSKIKVLEKCRLIYMYRLGCNGAPIGNGMTSCDRKMSWWCPRCI